LLLAGSIGVNHLKVAEEARQRLPKN